MVVCKMRLRVNNALLHKLGFVQPLYTFILPGFGVVRGRILVFFIDLRGRLYNNLALLCECMIHVEYLIMS